MQNPWDELYGGGVGNEYETGWEQYGDPQQFLPGNTPPATPWEAPVEEEPSGGGGGGAATGGYGQGPYGEFWAGELGKPGGFFNQWQEGGYGYDPEWMRQQTVGAEDYWNEWRNRMGGEATENLATTGRLYSGGPRSRMQTDIDEAFRENLGGDINKLSIANLESQLSGRQNFFNSLMGYLSGERGYGLDLEQLGISRAGLGLQGQALGLQETGMYMDFLMGLMGGM